MHTPFLYYPMIYLDAEYQSSYLEYMETSRTCDKYYLFSKASDICIALYFCQSTKSRNGLDQALQDIVQ